jgi:hypothetical protein
MTDNDSYCHLGNPDGGQISFGKPIISGDGSGLIEVPVMLAAFDLRAAGRLELQPWGGGTQAWLRYLQDLASSWRGWAGDRRWDDDGAGFSIRAAHDGRGTIQVTARLTPRGPWSGPGAWAVELTVGVDAGRLDGFVAELRAALDA